MYLRSHLFSLFTQGCPPWLKASQGATNYDRQQKKITIMLNGKSSSPNDIAL